MHVGELIKKGNEKFVGHFQLLSQESGSVYTINEVGVLDEELYTSIAHVWLC